MSKKKAIRLLGDVFGLFFVVLIYIIPFAYMILNSLKDRKEANLLEFSLPSVVHLGNYLTVFTANNYELIRAFKNSALLTVFSVSMLILTCSMSGYVIQRRRDRKTGMINNLIMTGMMIPAAVMPTIWLLKFLHIYKTLFSLVMIEVALQTPFTTMLYRGFVGSIPSELEEAGIIDGCTRRKLFTAIVFPLLKPVTSTVIILNAVTIFNDFTNPLYFLPGSENTTVQLTLYNYIGQYSSSYNLLFANIILITLPMLILFLFFNKKIVSGMVAGSVKG